jgi:hypothetical protein
MSTEHIVNRVSNTVGQDIEEAKLSQSETLYGDGSVLETAREVLNIPREVVPSETAGLPAGMGYLDLSDKKIDEAVEYHVPAHVGEIVVLQPYQVAVYPDGTRTKRPGQKVDGQIGEIDTGMDYTESQEEVNGNKVEEPAPEVVDWSGANGHFTTAEVVAMVANRQVQFEDKVIAAFRHFGLDINRFFGEQ